MAEAEVPLRARIERGFEDFGRMILRRRWLTLGLSLLLASVCASQLPTLEFDASPESFLHPDAPDRLAWEDFRTQFGKDDYTLIVVDTPDPFSEQSLERLRAFHKDLEDNVPYLDEVSSLINARSTLGNEEELIVEDLFEDWPETEAQREAIRARALANPLYKNLVLSNDGRLSTVVARGSLYKSNEADDALSGFDEESANEPSAEEMVGNAEAEEMVNALLAVMERHQKPDFKLVGSGTPVITDGMVKSMGTDMQKFLVVMIGIICVVLFSLFRRVSAVVLTLLVVILSIVSTLGIMAWVGVSINIPTQILPSFLLAVGIGAAVHLLTVTYLEIDQGRPRDEAIVHALGHSGLAILMTGLTTAGGMLSFSVAELAPISHVGIFAPIGILLGLVYCLVMLPVLLSLTPLKARKSTLVQRGGFLERVLIATGDFSVRNPRWMMAAAAVLIVGGLVSARTLHFSHDFLGWFPEDHMVRKSTEIVDRDFKGSMSLEVLVDTGRENGLHDPQILRDLDALNTDTVQAGLGVGFEVGKTLSVTDVLKEINQALNENRSDYYSIPEERQLIAQELLLFENSGSDDLEDLVDSVFSTSRFTIRVPYQDAINYVPFVKSIQEVFEARLGERAQVQVTGLMKMMSGTIYAVMHSMAASYVMALAIITPLMMLLIGNLRAGLASMVPNLAPIITTLGLMGVLGLSIDTFTLMIGGIAIGLAVDDTIHFIHNYRRYFDETGDPQQATRKTLETTGKAMAVTSIVLSAGFSVYMLSSMGNLFIFGALISFCIAAAFILDVILAPALMALTLGREKRLTPQD
ncbi:MAG: MMPL family transporter [bacterium]|nr:MMPL family transporter [bacterium]